MQRILLADDNKLNQLVAVGTLKRLGYQVETVDCGAKAVEACATSHFDAVLMDIMMPGMDGYEATGHIRRGEASAGVVQRTPIIGLSARAMEGDRERALAAGLDDYLTKPLREEQLTEVFGRWIQPGEVDGPHLRLASVSDAGPTAHRAGW